MDALAVGLDSGSEGDGQDGWIVLSGRLTIIEAETVRDDRHRKIVGGLRWTP